MKKVFKYLWVIPILVATLFVGVLFLPNSSKNSFDEFQNFSKAYLQLIRAQDDIENFDGIKLDLSKDLTCNNGIYMIDGNHFAKVTGSKITYRKSGELKIIQQQQHY